MERWARARDLRDLRVRAPVGGRITLGVHGRRLLAAEPRASLVVLGPSQSGKTTGLAIPAIRQWRGPVVATSVKSDLVHATIGHRPGSMVFDPTGVTGQAAVRWSPLAGCDTWVGARKTAAWLCSAARSGQHTLNDEEFWYAAAAKLLSPYLLAARLGGMGMDTVVEWIDAQEENEVGRILRDEPRALNAACASWARQDPTRNSVFTTAEMVLEANADPTVLASASSTDIDPTRFCAQTDGTLYICAPSHEQERLRPVFATLLQSIITAAYEAASRHGPLDPPLLLVLDEAANIAPLRDLDTLASTAAGHGIQLVTVWQDLAQVRVRYGERASTVVNNHKAKLVLSGIADPATLEYTSRLIGDTAIKEHSVTTGGDHRRSTTRSTRQQRLAPDAELRRIRPGEAVLVYGHLPPARIRLRRDTSRPATGRG